MKKHNGISLIETLISLTIVGLCITALLPVMTLRKDANDPTKSNKFWKAHYENEEDSSGNILRYEIPGSPKLTIGSTKAPLKGNFMVASEGFKNSSIQPANIQKALYFRGQTISSDKTNGTLYIKQGALGTENRYPKSIYLDNNNTIIENNITNNNTTHGFHIHEGNKYVDRMTRNSTVISNNDIEYINVDSTNRVIGIGQNAIKYRAPETTNFVAIFNLGDDINNIPTTVNSDAPTRGFAIGTKALNAANNIRLSEPNFIIQQQGDLNTQINTNVDATAAGFRATYLLIPSDKRLKEIISKFEKGITEVGKLEPVEFTYKNDETEKLHAGVIAQDLQKIFPLSVRTGHDGYLVINTDEIFYAVLNSIKEMDKKNKAIAEENKKLEQKIAELRKIRDNLKTSKGGNNE